ncbi:transcriptional adapter ADA2 isoform X2 [Henckelia pumila]|uniref:transcriptional adapter ADA2 isoform X2 n=1 Tax=Henckelia pumila TaxID=405737 RepID=UPI003C6DF945
MGRSRAAVHAADEDSGQSRSKRKRTAQNVENAETMASGMTDGKKALYHCNYCNKDISGKIRIKCVICSDFDLCIECFSVGAEVYPHKSSHPYRVMDNLVFPLICAEWNADEEILLLEGIEMYGLGNWTEVAEHVGTKSRSQCTEHYDEIYMNSPCFPLPDMSHVMGKNREELLAMARENSEIKKGATTCEDIDVKVEFPPAGIKVEDQRKEGPAVHSSLKTSSEIGTVGSSISGTLSTGASQRTSSKVQSNDGLDAVKVEDFHADRSIGEKKPRTSGNEGVSLKELSGYNSKRREFEVEYDNDAEQLLADMEFKETDTNAERELKLRVLHIYSKRLNERRRRKDFILERNLLYPDPFEKDLTLEEKELSHRYRVFMRYHSKDEHVELLRSIIEEHRILKRIEGLQEARAAGCRTSADAERYIERKRMREIEENARQAKDTYVGPGGKYMQRLNFPKGEQDSSLGGGIKSPTYLDSGGNDSLSTTIRPNVPSVSEKWDVTGFLGADMLSEAEKELCGEIRILPTHYLNMLQTMSMGILNGNLSKKSDAHGLFNVDSGKVDRVYDMLVKKGIA